MLQELNFASINLRAKNIAKFIKDNKRVIINILIHYETYEVANDEILRTLDLLMHLSENAEYFKKEVGGIAVFLPRNQPLYAFACFAIIPSFMAKNVYVKAPETMGQFFFDLIENINVKLFLPNIHIARENRENFVIKHSAIKLNKLTNTWDPIIDAVIFTGTMENADKLRKRFSPKILFIANGSGHNPVIITETADIKKAVESALRLQLYNQGQDCAAPNTILVHEKNYHLFLNKLKQELSHVKVGPYSDKDSRVGPMTKVEDFIKIQKILIENYKWIDPATEGVFRIKSKFIEPTIIDKPLGEGGNYTEMFAPVFFIQKYNNDKELALYFENSLYKKNAMYVTLFGESEYVESLIENTKNARMVLHDRSTIIKNTDLHATGVERGTQPYGGFGRGASCLSMNGTILPMPTLPQRDIYRYVVCKENMSSKDKIKKVNANLMLKNYKKHDEVKHWAEIFAEKVMEKFPNEEIYTGAAGISPSGVVHFGNFRDVITAFAVTEKLKEDGKPARLIFSWDDFDRFRKVPAGIDVSFEQHIGQPLSVVPSPSGNYASYADEFEKEFEESMNELGIHLEYKYQTAEYHSGKYDDLIIHAINNRKEIADILISFMTEKGKINKSILPEEYKENYYPISIYSRFSGKDNTRVLEYDGNKKITYKCFDTGETETIDFTKDRIVKLSWKTDWPMRWKMENVVFEPGGRDHASPSGSYDVSSVIANQIFSIRPPIFGAYDFVGIQGLGTKMSGSKGNAVSPRTLLEIYTPELLKWIYLQKLPSQTFSIAFNSEIYKQYSEFDSNVEILKKNELDNWEKDSLLLSGVEANNLLPPIPFRQAVAFGQIVQWDKNKLSTILRSMDLKYDPKSISARIDKARAWLETYNKEEIIELLSEANTEYIKKLSTERIAQVRILRQRLSANSTASMKKLEQLVYDIPKNPNLSIVGNSPIQRAFFKDIYNLLIGKDTGPRLSTFLWAVDRKQVLKLLDL